MTTKKFQIIRDTREQNGWDFYPDDKFCMGMLIDKLDTGDYSLDGFQDMFCIERKGCVSEFANNVTENRFDKELVRMSQMKYPFMLLEFSASEMLAYPNIPSVPKFVAKKSRITGNFLLKKVNEYQIEYGVHIIFGHNRLTSLKIAEDLFKRIYGTKV